MIVSEILARILPRIAAANSPPSGFSFIDAFNRAADIFFCRLHSIKSEIAREQFEDQTIDEEFVYLPDDFRGFASPLKLVNSDGDKSDLKELPYDKAESEGSEPIYYRLVGPFKMQMTPRPDTDDGFYSETFTLDGFYYAHPGTFELTEETPWEGLFDRQFEDAVLIILSVGGMAAVDASVIERIESLIDSVTFNRVVKPRRNKLYR